MATMHLMTAGMGIILFSPSMADHIAEGEKYLQNHFWDPTDVQRHLQAGSIVGVCTGSPGDYHLEFRSGRPSLQELAASDFTARLGLRNVDGRIAVCDLFALVHWEKHVPEEQILPLPIGIYHLVFCTNKPVSGRWGDHQTIRIHMEQVTDFPAIPFNGVPMLCP